MQSSQEKLYSHIDPTKKSTLDSPTASRTPAGSDDEVQSENQSVEAIAEESEISDQDDKKDK